MVSNLIIIEYFNSLVYPSCTRLKEKVAVGDRNATKK
jgi:hypothetical protein